MHTRAKELGQRQALIFAVIGLGVALLFLALIPGLLKELLKEYGTPILLGAVLVLLMSYLGGRKVGQLVSDTNSYVKSACWGTLLAFTVVLLPTFGCTLLVLLHHMPVHNPIPALVTPVWMVFLVGGIPALILGSLYGYLLKRRLLR